MKSILGRHIEFSLDLPGKLWILYVEKFILFDDSITSLKMVEPLGQREKLIIGGDVGIQWGYDLNARFGIECLECLLEGE